MLTIIGLVILALDAGICLGIWLAPRLAAAARIARLDAELGI